MAIDSSSEWEGWEEQKTTKRNWSEGQGPWRGSSFWDPWRCRAKECLWDILTGSSPIPKTMVRDRPFDNPRRCVYMWHSKWALECEGEREGHWHMTSVVQKGSCSHSQLELRPTGRWNLATVCPQLSCPWSRPDADSVAILWYKAFPPERRVLLPDMSPTHGLLLFQERKPYASRELILGTEKPVWAQLLV